MRAHGLSPSLVAEVQIRSELRLRQQEHGHPLRGMPYATVAFDEQYYRDVKANRYKGTPKHRCRLGRNLWRLHAR